MKETAPILSLALPYVMSCVTLFAIWAAGDKRAWAWLVSLGNQGLWGLWIYLTWPQASGLVPMCLCLTVMYARNFKRWRDESVKAEAVNSARANLLQDERARPCLE